MAGREERIAIFHGTLQMITGNSKLKESVAMSVRNQMIIWQEDSVDYAERWDRPAKVLLSAKRTLEAAEPYVKAGKKVCILNFASSVASQKAHRLRRKASAGSALYIQSSVIQASRHFMRGIGK